MKSVILPTRFSAIITAGFCFLCPFLSWSSELSQTFTLDGQLLQAGTTSALLDANVKFVVQILNPDKTCLLYEEEQFANTITSNGYYNLQIGSATGALKRTASDPGRTMSQIFQNSSSIVANSAPTQTCIGGTYAPASRDDRYFRLIITPSATGVADTLSPDTIMDSVPSALVAQSLQGRSANEFLQTTADTTQAKINSLMVAATYSELTNLLGGTSTQYLTSSTFSPSGAVDFNNQNITNTANISVSGAASRAINMSRNPTVDTAGNQFTLAAGGATSGATDKNGGTLVLASGTATGLGSSSIQFQTASPDIAGTADRTPSTKMTILGSGRVGIGIVDPQVDLHVGGSEGAIRAERAGNNWYSAPAFDFVRSRGTLAAKSVVTQGDSVGEFYFRPYNGITNVISASFGGAIDGTPVGDDVPTAIYFSTSTNNAASFTERMRISSNGNVGIGTADPKSSLQVTGYIQLALVAGTPAATDCDAADEYGRMKFDSSAGVNRLYICAADGWIFK